MPPASPNAFLSAVCLDFIFFYFLGFRIYFTDEAKCSGKIHWRHSDTSQLILLQRKFPKTHSEVLTLPIEWLTM